MEQNRREFLTGAAWKGLCDSDRFDFSKGVTGQGRTENLTGGPAHFML